MQKDKKQFLTAIWDMIDKVEAYQTTTERQKMQMVAFCILCMLDGDSVNLPAYTVCPEDELMDDGMRDNISGSLHDEFYTLGAKQKRHIE